MDQDASGEDVTCHSVASVPVPFPVPVPPLEIPISVRAEPLLATRHRRTGQGKGVLDCQHRTPSIAGTQIVSKAFVGLRNRDELDLSCRTKR